MTSLGLLRFPSHRRVPEHLSLLSSRISGSPGRLLLSRYKCLRRSSAQLHSAASSTFTHPICLQHLYPQTLAPIEYTSIQPLAPIRTLQPSGPPACLALDRSDVDSFSASPRTGRVLRYEGHWQTRSLGGFVHHDGTPAFERRRYSSDHR